MGRDAVEMAGKRGEVEFGEKVDQLVQPHRRPPAGERDKGKPDGFHDGNPAVEEEIGGGVDGLGGKKRLFRAFQVAEVFLGVAEFDFEHLEEEEERELAVKAHFCEEKKRELREHYASDGDSEANRGGRPRWCGSICRR